MCGSSVNFCGASVTVRYTAYDFHTIRYGSNQRLGPAEEVFLPFRLSQLTRIRL